MHSTYLILHFPAKSQGNVFTHNFYKNVITIKKTRGIMVRFIHAIVIISIEKINLAKFRVLLQHVLCWIALNGTSRIVVPVTSTYPSTH
jgi:hypothetical protein